jgi:hypothetical protein
MFRFRLRTLFFAFAAVSVVCSVLVLISRIGAPVVVMVAPADPTAEFTADNIIEWTRLAMLKAGLTPTTPVVWNHELEGNERFIGRNSYTPNDRAFIQWYTGTDNPTYAGMVERSPTQIIVSVSRNY